MLLPENMQPEVSIYYNGAMVLKELQNSTSNTVIDIYQVVKEKYEMSFPIFLLSLDWLYLIDVAVMDEKGADVVSASSEIIFDNVDFSYADRKILDHVSFTIPDGTTTAIVGPSGSGKTTMCNLIARFWDVDAGRITVGGKDVRDFKLDSLMKNISMVFQNVYLFADSIENNIKFGCPDATHEQVVEAAKKACCDKFISALPDGYDMVIGEGGGTLSGGEKQRISIARALIQNPNIIIFDDSTSAVDSLTEKRIRQAMKTSHSGCTKFIIAQRISSVRDADKILVLGGGKIVAKGNHKYLMETRSIRKSLPLR